MAKKLTKGDLLRPYCLGDIRCKCDNSGTYKAARRCVTSPGHGTRRNP